MSAPFAAAEARVNRAVMARLSNAMATLPGGEQVAVIFEAPFSAPFGQVVESTQPLVLAQGHLVAGLVQGSEVQIGGVTYTVERVEPDGTGTSRVTVYEA